MKSASEGRGWALIAAQLLGWALLGAQEHVAGVECPVLDGRPPPHECANQNCGAMATPWMVVPICVGQLLLLGGQLSPALNYNLSISCSTGLLADLSGL